MKESRGCGGKTGRKGHEDLERECQKDHFSPPGPRTGTTRFFSPSGSLPLLTPTVCWPAQRNRVAWPGEPWYLSGSVVMLRMNQATGSIRSYDMSHSRHVREHPSQSLLLLSYFCRPEEEFHGSLGVASWGLGFAI